MFASAYKCVMCNNTIMSPNNKVSPYILKTPVVVLHPFPADIK